MKNGLISVLEIQPFVLFCCVKKTENNIGKSTLKMPDPICKWGHFQQF